MPRYFAAPGSPFRDEDAELLGPWLEGMAEAGTSSPEEIVHAARDEDSPGHPYFEWDDAVAAEAHRRQQARKVANSIMVKVRTADGYESVRAFYSVAVSVVDAATEPTPKRKYVTVQQVRDTSIYGQQVIEEARARLQAWAERYERYREQFPGFEEEFRPVFEVIEGGRAA